MLQAVVVSIDPRRVYLVHPDDSAFKAVRVKNPGNCRIVFFKLKFVWSFVQLIGGESIDTSTLNWIDSLFCFWLIKLSHS